MCYNENWMNIPLMCLWSINQKVGEGMLGTILLVILILLLLGALPAWPYSAGWGYGPSGLLGVILVIFIILLLLGRI